MVAETATASIDQKKHLPNKRCNFPPCLKPIARGPVISEMVPATMWINKTVFISSSKNRLADYKTVINQQF